MMYKIALMIPLIALIITLIFIRSDCNDWREVSSYPASIILGLLLTTCLFYIVEMFGYGVYLLFN